MPRTRKTPRRPHDPAAAVAALRASALQTSDSILARQRQEELDMRNLLASIVDSSDDAIITTDAQGRVTSWNRAAEALYGYRAADAIGRPSAMLFPPGYQDIETRWDPGVQTLRQHFETTRVRKDGSLVNVSVTLSPLLGPDGIAMGSSRIVRDITARRFAEERLHRSNRDLEDFAYIASHDLQAPLRSVCGFAQLLHKQYGGRLDARADEYLHHMVDSAEHMQQLIHGVLEYSKVGRGELEPVPVDSAAALARARQQLRSVIAECKARVVEGPLPRVVGVEIELVQLFQNLLGNALKFQPPDREPRIEVSATPCGPLWRFRVSDNGIGIAPEHFGRLFRMFQRLHTPDAYAGTGIGLAVCQKIVHRHGGTISVESVPGQGATFSFTLRAAAPP